MKKKREIKSIRKFNNHKRYTVNENDLLRGKIEFLLSKYGEGEKCKISSNILQRVIDDLIKKDKGDAILEYSVKRNGIEERYAILNVEETMILAKIEKGVAELSKLSKSMSLIDLPKESLKLDDIFVCGEKMEYTLNDFIKDTNISSVPGLVPIITYQDFRPLVVCKDGFTLSIQASRLHQCTPRKNNMDNYTEFELSEIDDDIPELLPYEKEKRYNSLLWNNRTRNYGYVPKALVEKILEEHGGIDKEKTLEVTELDLLKRKNKGLLDINGYLDQLGIKSDLIFDKDRKYENKIGILDRKDDDKEYVL